jgi:hypothetical protein
MSTPLDDAIRRSNRSMFCDQTVSHINTMGRICHPASHTSLQTLAERVAALPVPKNDEEQNRLVRQTGATSGIVNSIPHASTMSKMCPWASAVTGR